MLPWCWKASQPEGRRAIEDCKLTPVEMFGCLLKTTSSSNEAIGNNRTAGRDIREEQLRVGKVTRLLGRSERSCSPRKPS
jgi:hypothetical protein